MAFTVAAEQNVGTIGTTGSPGKVYPASLAGENYPEGGFWSFVLTVRPQIAHKYVCDQMKNQNTPKGIPIIWERDLESFIRENKVDEVQIVPMLGCTAADALSIITLR